MCRMNPEYAHDPCNCCDAFLRQDDDEDDEEVEDDEKRDDDDAQNENGYSE
jgi:hypothetical protein